MFTIAPERPDSPEVIALIAELDAYLATLYPPENNYLLSVEDLLLPEVIFLVARREGRAVGCGALRRDGEHNKLSFVFVPDQAKPLNATPC
jgi:putative acetyltransferase